MIHRIQTDGIIKEYKPEELPDGCVAIGEGRITGKYFTATKQKGLWKNDGNTYLQNAFKTHRIIDIINPETGESTHVKRWSAVDRDGYVFIYYEKPKRLNEGNSGTWDGPRQLSDEYILYPSNGQTWEDEPRPVWIEIPKDTE
jgi:hypothetical protein